MIDLLSIVLGMLASTFTTLLVIAIAERQPRDAVDFSGWTPPDESTETTEVALYFDGIGREVRL